MSLQRLSLISSVSECDFLIFVLVNVWFVLKMEDTTENKAEELTTDMTDV